MIEVARGLGADRAAEAHPPHMGTRRLCGVWALDGNCVISQRSTRRASMAASLQQWEEAFD
jgi:hypothetical protein